MNVEFIRFNATDGVSLQGWYTDVPGDTAVIHIHGKGGNGYENPMLDTLRTKYEQLSVSFLSIDTRGRGVMSFFEQGSQLDEYGEGKKKGGSCYEIFNESEHDISAAVNFVQSRGKKRIILEGHSLGCSKTVNFLLKHPDTPVIATILLAPTDMAGWGSLDPKHEDNLKRAHELVDAGKPTEILGAQMGLDADPISAESYIGMYQAGTDVDIYGERDGGPLLGRVSLPTIILYSRHDIGIVKVYDNIENYLSRTLPILNENSQVIAIEGAAHNFRHHENELADSIEKFISELTV